MDNKNEAAFAKSAFYHPDGGIDPPQIGLTKREYFAGLAMQVYALHPNYYTGSPDKHAEAAVKLADALLNELNK